jgi:hypothetical protein
MSINILDQVVEFDQSTKSWGRFDANGGLIHYHDTMPQAIRAAIPEELAAWSLRQRDQRRALKAAMLVVNGEIKPDQEAYGIYSKAYSREENGFTYTGYYTINVRAATCTCPDFQFTHKPCKHLLGASYLFQQYRAEVKRSQATLWNLAQAAIEEHKHEEIEHLVIWSGPGGREAYIAPIKGFENRLYLFVSGHPHGLACATRRYPALQFDKDSPLFYWGWSCKEESYKWWVEKLQANS